MAVKIYTGEWVCSVCGHKYTSQVAADKCRDDHDIVYIPMTTTEFNRLLNALAFGDLSVIPESLMDTLRKYQRSLARK